MCNKSHSTLTVLFQVDALQNPIEAYSKVKELQTALENPSEFISREEEHQRLLEVLESAGDGKNSSLDQSVKGSIDDISKESASHKNSLVETQTSIDRIVHQVSFDKVSLG